MSPTKCSELYRFEDPFNYLQSLAGVSSFTSQLHPLLQLLVPHLTLPVFDLPYRCNIALGSLGEIVRRDFHRGRKKPAWEWLGKQRGGFHWQEKEEYNETFRLIIF